MEVLMTLNVIGESFGYHTTDTVSSGEQEHALILNALNGAGYIPGIGIGTLVMRCLIIRNHSNDFSPIAKVVFIGRGVLEALGLGLLLLIPDLIVSIARHLCGKCQPEPVYYSRYSRHTSYEESYY